EYLMQIQPGSLFPDPQRYGVLWMGRVALAAAQDMVGAFNDLSFTVAPGADPSDVIERIDRLLTPYGGQGAMPAKDQASNFFIHQEFQQLSGMATMLPAIFLAVAVFLLNIVVTRLISLQREQIGVLKAFGYTDAAVGVHYLKLVLLVALWGAVIGDALGLYFGRQMGHLYLEYYRFPYLRYGVQPGVVLAAALLTTAATAVGALTAVRRAVRLPPATAMRPAIPAAYTATVFERLGLKRFLDQPTRMIVRNLGRRPVRALLTVVGIASSAAILVMGLFFEDSYRYVLQVQYGLAQRENLAVTFTQPTSSEAVQELAALPGVELAEASRTVPVRLRHEQRRYDSAIEGVPPSPVLRRVIDDQLRPVAVPAQGIVLTDRLGQILHVGAGDSVSVEFREGDRRTVSVPVVALTQQFIGVAAYMDMGALNRLVGTGHAVSGAYLMTDPRQDEALTAALQRRPRVAAITSQQRSIQAVNDSYERSSLTFAFVLTLFAGFIAFGVVYNSARIALSERDRELASLRVLGLTRGEIA
ncbi:MAG TPA: FtsX-like permease family protein, partial [Longimicrobiales bacterium]